MLVKLRGMGRIKAVIGGEIKEVKALLEIWADEVRHYDVISDGVTVETFEHILDEESVHLTYPDEYEPQEDKLIDYVLEYLNLDEVDWMEV